MHRPPAKAFSAATVPHLVLRPGVDPVDLELTENLICDLIHDREDFVVALLPSGEGGESRISEVIHPALVAERDLGDVAEGWRGFNLISVVKTVAETELNVHSRWATRGIRRERSGIRPVGVIRIILP